MKVFLLVLLVLATQSSFVSDSVQLVDIAKQVGLTDNLYCGGEKTKKYIIETLGGGVALFDYNNDGYVDVFFVTGTTLAGFPAGQEPSNQLYRNNKDGTFTNATKEAGLVRSGWGQGACVGDYDNDGFDDLFVTYYGQNYLYRNSGTGTFVDSTESAGLKQETRWGTGCAFLDYDRDGNLDLFVANYIVFDKDKTPVSGASSNCQWKGYPVLCGPLGLPGGTNQLFHNEGGSKFKNVSENSKVSAVSNTYSLSVTPLDFDHDGWPDIYVAVDSKPSILFRNNRDGTFTDVGLSAGVAFNEEGYAQAGMGTAAGDFDGDGNLDLVKTNFIDDTANLYRNGGDGTFDDYARRTEIGTNKKFLGWGTGFVDYDNDAWPDIFMVNGHVYPELEGKVPDSPFRQRSILYRNVNGKRLVDVSESAGSGVTAKHSSRGVAFGDFDNDGDVDIFVNNMNEPPSLLRNEGGNSKSFLSLRLVGVKSNRDGIGARVTVTAQATRQVQEVRSGSSFMSHSDLRLHFGLGSANSVDKIEIQWPFAGSNETIINLGSNQFVTITEGKGVTASKSSPLHERKE